MKKLMIICMSFMLVQLCNGIEVEGSSINVEEKNYDSQRIIEASQLETEDYNDEDDEKNEDILYPIETSYIIEHNSEIDISFYIGKSNEEYFDYKTDLFTKEKITYRISVDSLGESSIPLSLTKNGVLVETFVFVYSTEEKDYISTISISSAKRLYFQEQYELGKVKLEDYNTIVFGDTVIDKIVLSRFDESKLNLTPTTRTPTGYIYIEGSINYSDKNAVTHGAEGVKYIIYDNGIEREELDSGYTNSSGEYSVVISNDNGVENGYDILVRFEWGDGDFSVHDGVTMYHHEIDYGVDIIDETVLTTETILPLSSEQNDAMHLFQAGLIGFKHLRDVSGDSSFSNLSVQYPASYSTSNYAFLTNEINIISSNGHQFYANSVPQDWDTFLHEFGHYVADEYNFTGIIYYPHSLSDNLSMRWTKWIGTQLAWQEGFAHYYCISSQLAYSTSISVPGAGTIEYKGRSLESFELYKYGEHNELAVAKVLFDLADVTPNEFLNSTDHDLISYTDEGLFNELIISSTNGQIDTLSEFMNDLYLQQPLDNFGPILEMQNVVGGPVTPSLYPTIDSSAPLFIWSRGGHGVFENNNFTLVIKSLNGVTLLTKDVGDETSYVLSTLEWDNLLNYNTSHFIWHIEEDQNSILINTGTYISNTQMVQSPTGQTVIQNVPIYESLNEFDNDWFVFTPNVNGIYEIFTTGTTDTYGELSNRIVADGSTNDIIKNDQDSGMNTNFEIKVYLTKDDPIYIRVTPGQATSTGGYYLVAQLAPASC